MVAGKIHFIRVVNSNGDITILNEKFHIGDEYIGEFVWATVDTGKQVLIINYNDEEMRVKKIKQYEYKID